MVVSNNRLTELMDEVKRCYEIASETGSVPGVRINSSLYAAFTELAERRRVEAAVEKMLGMGLDLEVFAIIEPIEGVTIRVLDRTFRTIMFSKTADTFHAALAKLVATGGES